MKAGYNIGNQVYLHLSEPNMVDTGLDYLNSIERQRAGRFQSIQDRRLYVAAHVFLRQVLSRYTTLYPEEWRFSTGEYGKPAVSNRGMESLKFSLSHTHGLLACAVSWQQTVGVDIEQPLPLKNFRALCQTVLSNNEMTEVLAGRDSMEQERRFYTYWTLKEAYVKALGCGFAAPVQRMNCVRLSEQQWSMQHDEEEGGVIHPPVTLMSRYCTNGYPLAVAVI
uniref:Uncharacterized protein n=1 Tax=uncultured Thiotrichaceae bacterium TaxID=298394 RepID=A0A6S6TKI5_9GAMM|nr:MAG: Unknown protein [uncultured Thiotrichaceae bacterium]